MKPFCIGNICGLDPFHVPVSQEILLYMGFFEDDQAVVLKSHALTCLNKKSGGDDRLTLPPT